MLARILLQKLHFFLFMLKRRQGGFFRATDLGTE